MEKTVKPWDSIFKTGTWTSMNGATRNWTRADLEQLVANTGDNAAIVIHHPEDQSKAFEFGKIARLRRMGDFLQAQYRDVPEILSMAVKEGLKLAKSVSIDPKKMTIRHLGLLGAGQPPAVDGLGPASFSVGKVGGNEGETLLTYMFSQTNFKKEETVDPKDKKIQELENEISALKAGEETKKLQGDLDHAKDDLKAEKDAHEKTKQEFADYKAAQAEKGLQARVDALAETGRIKPAEKDKVMAFAKAMADDNASMEFAAPDGKKEAVTPREHYLRDLEAREPDKDGLLSEFARADHAGAAADTGDDFKDINNFA